ncbi:MAG: transposase, partial [Syntrophobacterales bacterium]|nr:transposase [Syntrophobacterales bacterium]
KWPVSERTSLGHFDLVGDFVPSRHFLALDEQQQLATGLIDEPYIRKSKETRLLVRKRCGFDLLFSHAARRTHVDRILRVVFPSDWKALLSLVFFNLAEPYLPMYRFNRFDRNNLHPYGQNVHKDMITGLLRLVDEQARSSTFEMLRKANSKEGARLLALDSTSIAALGELLYRASRGYSKEGLRDEEQLELLTVYDLRTRIPLYYRTLEGKIADVATLENTAGNLQRDGMEPKYVVFVMDRGYYSDINVRHLLKARYKFVCAVDIRRHAFVNECVRLNGPSVLCADNYIEDKDLYCARFRHSIDIPRRGRGENLMNLALDICFNPERAKREQQLLSRKIAKMRAALERGQATLEPNSEYSRLFTAVEEKVYGQGTVTSFVVRTDQEQRERSLCGYFA